MKDKIQKILERELSKLDAISATDPLPLGSRDVRSLDTLIKAYRSFVDPGPPSPGAKKPSASDPSSLPIDQLLAEVNARQD